MLYDLVTVKYQIGMDTNDAPGVIVAHFTATLYLHSQCSKEDKKNNSEISTRTQVMCTPLLSGCLVLIAFLDLKLMILSSPTNCFSVLVSIRKLHLI